MNKILEWIKENKLATALIVVVAYLLFAGSSNRVLLGVNGNYYGKTQSAMPMSNSLGYGGADIVMESRAMVVDDGYYPIPEPDSSVTSGERKVTTSYDYAVLVKEVDKVEQALEDKTVELGGFVISSNVSTPYEGGSGYITLRVPNENVEEMRKFISDSALRVVSENTNSSDITEAYYDAEARLETLNKTLARLDEWFDEAENVSELINLQNNIDRTQTQIDAVKGRLEALSAKSETTKISVSISTDELALPYSPNQPWRPNVVFKLAVRDLITTLRGFGDQAIYLAVYAVIWIPALAIAWYIRRLWLQKKAKKSKSK